MLFKAWHEKQKQARVARYSPLLPAQVCQTVYSSSCTTKYIENESGQLLGDTSCQKLPQKVCGAGCSFVDGEQSHGSCNGRQETVLDCCWQCWIGNYLTFLNYSTLQCPLHRTTGEESCRDSTVTSMVDVPEEVCDLNPQKVQMTHFLPLNRPTTDMSVCTTFLYRYLV